MLVLTRAMHAAALEVKERVLGLSEDSVHCSSRGVNRVLVRIPEPNFSGRFYAASVRESPL